MVKGKVWIPSAEGIKASRAVCSALGKKGHETTTKRYFNGKEREHRNWLRVHAAALYADFAGRPGYIGGKFPPRVKHPSKLSPYAKNVYKWISDNPSEIVNYYAALTDSDLHCIEAAVFGLVRGRRHWRLGGGVPW